MLRAYFSRLLPCAKQLRKVLTIYVMCTVIPELDGCTQFSI